MNAPATRTFDAKPAVRESVPLLIGLSSSFRRSDRSATSAHRSRAAAAGAVHDLGGQEPSNGR